MAKNYFFMYNDGVSWFFNNIFKIISFKRKTRNKMPAKIIEVDAPKMAYFEYPENGSIKRVIYNTLALQSKNPHKLAIILDNLLENIRSQDISIIYWRMRPEIEWDNDPDLINGNIDNRKFNLIMRLATEPKLPDTFWEETGCLQEEGEEYIDIDVYPWPGHVNLIIGKELIKEEE